MTQLELKDNYSSIGLYNNEIFEIKSDTMRLHDFDDDIQLAITYELDRSRKVIRRKVYSILDWLGDIGGLAGAIKALFTASIILFQYRASTSYVSNHTYRILPGQIDHNNGCCRKRQSSNGHNKKNKS